MQSISTVSLLVKDYDEAIDWFRRCLSFTVAVDQPLSPGKRFVRLETGHGTGLLLHKAQTKQDLALVGKQCGDAVFMILQTDDFLRAYRHMQNSGVVFIEQPRDEPYGTVVIFKDLCGNKWDLIQPADD